MTEESKATLSEIKTYNDGQTVWLRISSAELIRLTVREISDMSVEAYLKALKEQIESRIAKIQAQLDTDQKYNYQSSLEALTEQMRGLRMALEIVALLQSEEVKTK